MTAREIAEAVAAGAYRFCPSTSDKCAGCEWSVTELAEDIRNAKED